jgi:hypothetical protein
MTNQPFAAAEHISDLKTTLTRGGEARLIASRLTTDASAAAEIGYSDITFGNITAGTWTNVDIGATNGDVVNILGLLFYDRLYAAVGAAGSVGEVWVSSNLGETWTEVYTGTTTINAFAKGYGQDCYDVYAVGATNLIMVERARSGSFEALVGPSGGGEFTAITVARNGLIFAGNGTSLYVSYNGAINAGGWTSVKNFGVNYIVKNIWLAQGDSQHIYVEVTKAATDGELWHSNDGGNSWTLVTVLANVGYTDGYQSVEDDNLFYLVGNVNASPLGVVHKASPSASGC